MILGAVRRMTRRAFTLGNRHMDGFAIEHGFVVTCHAQTDSRRLKHILVIRLVRIMTILAFAFGNRLVGESPVKLAFLMARQAESPSILFQLEPFVALMRVMTVSAITGCNRRMNIFFSIFTIVTFMTERRFAPAGHGKCLFFKLWMPLVGRLVA